MIGKVQDVVSAAVVIGAVTQNDASASREAGQRAAQAVQSASQQEEARSVQDTVRASAGTEEESRQKETQQREQPTADEMQDMMKELNELMSRINCNLKFQYHQEVNMMSVKMIDKATNEVIKEIPPEEMIENLIQSKEWIGAFLDKNA